MYPLSSLQRSWIPAALLYQSCFSASPAATTLHTVYFSLVPVQYHHNICIESPSNKLFAAVSERAGSSAE